MSARAGGLVTVSYDWESGFTSGSTMTSGKAFGRGQKITNVSVRENPEVIYELGYREAQNVTYKQFEGSLGVEWILSNPWFFKAAMGVASDSSLSAGVYTHSYTKTSGVLPSMEVDIGFAVDSWTLTGAINDVIRVKITAPYFREPATGMSFAASAVDSFAPFTFANASLVVAGNVIAEVQSFEISANNNVQPIFGLGSIYAQGAIPTQFDATGRLTVTMKDASFLGLLRTELTSAALMISNGLTSNSLVTCNVYMNGLNFGEHTVSYQPNQIIMENIPITVRDILKIESKNSSPQS
jgi:hypothetical protein